MFIIENGKIQGQKSLNIGKIRTINLAFQGDFAFSDDDKFKLSVGSVQSENFGFTNDGCISFNYVDVTKLITATTNSKAITITKNGTQILSDTLTLVADYSGGGSSGGETDLSNYVGDVSIKTATQDVITVDGSKIKIGDDTDLNIPTNATEIIYVKGKRIDIRGTETSVGGFGYIDFDTSGNINFNTYASMVDRLRLNGNSPNTPNGIVVANQQGTIDNCLLNKSFHNYGTSDANIYLDFTKAVSFIVLENLSCLTFLSNGCNDQTNLSTTEIWIKPNGTTIDTISYDSRIQLIGDMPTSFSADDDVNTVYVFVARYYYNNDDIIVMNYSHKFIDNWYNRDQQ